MMLFVYFIGTEIYLGISAPRKLRFERNANDSKQCALLTIQVHPELDIRTVKALTFGFVA